jgi:hypothetical protein
VFVTCKRIYLDTDLWNKLFYQNADPENLMDRLRARGANLVFSSHNLYEIAKSFHRTKVETKVKGKELVNFLLKFFAGTIQHPVESGELLKAEASANKFGRGVFESEVFVKASATNLFSDEAKALLQEELRPDIDEFISQRKEKLGNLRIKQMNHLANRPDLVARMKEIPSEGLTAYLLSESRSRRSLKVLDYHVRNVLPDLSPVMVRELSNVLLNSGAAPFTHSLVRATLYMNWRAANYGGLPTDIPDDMYHMLGATYCDVYATGEANQRYAKELIASDTLFQSYPRNGAVTVDDWLESLV